MINLLLNEKTINRLLDPKQISVGALYYQETEIQFYRTNLGNKIIHLTLFNNIDRNACSLKYVGNRFDSIDYYSAKYYCDRQDFILNSIPYSEKDFDDPAFEFNLMVLNDVDYQFFKLFKELRSTRFLLNFP